MLSEAFGKTHSPVSALWTRRLLSIDYQWADNAIWQDWLYRSNEDEYIDLL